MSPTYGIFFLGGNNKTNKLFNKSDGIYFGEITMELGDDIKLCVECKYCNYWAHLPNYSQCQHPNMTGMTSQFYVTGRTIKPYCVDCRAADAEGACGHDAKFFEPMEE